MTGLTNRAHAVQVVARANYCYLIGINVFTPGGGIQVYNAGVPTSVTSQWVGTGFVALFQMTTMQPADGFVLALAVNDFTAGIPAAASTANLSTVATNLRTKAPVALVATNNTAGLSDATWEPYVAGMYDVAADLNLPLPDVHYCWGGYTAAYRLGYEAPDGAHPSADGYREMARYAVALLTDAHVL